GSVLIKGATVLTVTRGTLENTDVLVEDGKIRRIGRGLQAPRGVETVEAAGMHLMPGIIDAHSHLGATGPVNEPTHPVTAEVSIEDVIDPYEVGLYRALAGGVTSSHIMHGSANAIGGQNETIKHRWGERDPEALKMAGAPRTIKFALGENPTRVHGRGNGVRPATRMGVEEVIRRAFAEARTYREATNAAARSNGRTLPPPYNLRYETLADILEGKVLVHCHSYRADEILMLLNVLKDFGVNRVVFQHANEAFKVAPELAAFGRPNGYAMASIFADWWAYKFEVYYSTAYNAAILTRNGVTTSINSDSNELDRHLYHEAAKTQRYGGLTDDEALALITINPARQLGVADRVGSIEEGKEADLALFRGHPLSIYGIPMMTFVDGVRRFDRERDGDDARLRVLPNERVDTAQIYAGHHDRCLEGVDLIGLASEE
ncbi:MAG TPA: amidohydrolase family protein, partial [Rhodothermales bacterium]|nr:amidohydrolase family protein [Rhodothermales bacterium]